MSSALIQKEQLSAYQRWEMGALEAADPLQPAGSARANAPALPTVDQIERIREEARLEGYKAGQEQGRLAGFEHGMQQAQEDMTSLSQLTRALTSEMNRADEAIAQDVLALALDVAQAILKTAIQVRPELILPAVRNAIHYLPTLQPQAQLFLHPADAQLVSQHIGEDLSKAGWRIVEEATLERGGCRVETSSNQIDGTLATRWQRIATVLGSTAEWLVEA